MEGLLNLAKTDAPIMYTLLAVAIGWMAINAAKKALASMKTSMANFPSTLVTSSMLGIAGLSGLGWGIGELRTHSTPTVANTKLQQVLDASDMKTIAATNMDASVKGVLEYANQHEQRQVDVIRASMEHQARVTPTAAVQKAKVVNYDDDPVAVTAVPSPVDLNQPMASFQMGWMTVCMSLGACLVGAITFIRNA